MLIDHSDESDSEDDEEGDAVSEIQEKVVIPKAVVKGRRTSVSAETIDPHRYDARHRLFSRMLSKKVVKGNGLMRCPRMVFS